MDRNNSYYCYLIPHAVRLPPPERLSHDWSVWVDSLQEVLDGRVSPQSLQTMTSKVEDLYRTAPKTEDDRESSEIFFTRRAGAEKVSAMLTRTDFYRNSADMVVVRDVIHLRRAVYDILRMLTWFDEVRDNIRESLLCSGVCQHITEDIKHCTPDAAHDKVGPESLMHSVLHDLVRTDYLYN